MKERSLKIPQDRLAEICKRYAIQKLALFGSVLRDDFREDSDVDLLVQFKEGHTPGFIKLYQIEEELSPLLGGHKPDLVTPKSLNHRIRQQILSEAEVQYAEG